MVIGNAINHINTIADKFRLAEEVGFKNIAKV